MLTQQVFKTCVAVVVVNTSLVFVYCVSQWMLL